MGVLQPHRRKFDHNQARELYEAGAPISVIAELFGVARHTVQYAVDLEFRKRFNEYRLRYYHETNEKARRMAKRQAA